MNWQNRIYESLVEGKKETTKELIAREQSKERKRVKWRTKKGSGMKGLSSGEAAEFGGDTTNDPRTTGLPK